MRMVSGLLALVAAALTATAASAAAPLDADCIWNAVPQAKQQAMLADYRRQGAASRLRPSDGEFRTINSACNVAATDEPRSRAIVAGRFMRWASEIVMQERYGIDAARLETAWSAVPLDQRREVGQAAFQEASGRPSDNPMLVVALSTFIDVLKAPDAAIGDAAFYFIGRALVQEISAGDQVV